ncbi:MAG: hypothetical protein AAFX02_10865 [Pseudomonadota bacterium]
MKFFVRIHRYLALAVGVQVIFWIVSGFYFTLFPIEEIRGSHLRNNLPSRLDIRKVDIVPVDELTRRIGGLKSVQLKPFLDGPIYEVEAAGGTTIYDAVTGESMSPISEDLATRLANAYWRGQGALRLIRFMEEPNQESGAEGPVWRAEFKGKDTASLYINADDGSFRSIRTTKWRIFDVLWGLHIMDWWNRSTFTSWWMKLFAGVSIFMAISGLIVGINQLRRGRFFT